MKYLLKEQSQAILVVNNTIATGFLIYSSGALLKNPNATTPRLLKAYLDIYLQIFSLMNIDRTNADNDNLINQFNSEPFIKNVFDQLATKTGGRMTKSLLIFYMTEAKQHVLEFQSIIVNFLLTTLRMLFSGQTNSLTYFCDRLKELLSETILREPSKIGIDFQKLQTNFNCLCFEKTVSLFGFVSSIQTEGKVLRIFDTTTNTSRTTLDLRVDEDKRKIISPTEAKKYIGLFKTSTDRSIESLIVRKVNGNALGSGRSA